MDQKSRTEKKNLPESQRTQTQSSPNLSLTKLMVWARALGIKLSRPQSIKWGYRLFTIFLLQTKKGLCFPAISLPRKCISFKCTVVSEKQNWYFLHLTEILRKAWWMLDSVTKRSVGTLGGFPFLNLNSKQQRQLQVLGHWFSASAGHHEHVETEKGNMQLALLNCCPRAEGIGRLFLWSWSPLIHIAEYGWLMVCTVRLRIYHRLCPEAPRPRGFPSNKSRASTAKLLLNISTSFDRWDTRRQTSRCLRRD